MNLVDSFASEENINLLTNALITKIGEIPSNFYDLFNNVASSVLNYEKERGKTLKEINEIIFKEVLRLINSKPVQIIKKDSFTNTESLKTHKKIFVLKDGENLLNIENVVDIKIMSVNLAKNIYNITEVNNKIFYNEDKISIVDPGNYSIQSLLKTLNKSSDISVKYNETTMKTNISIKKGSLDIDSFRSKGLLEVLGFSDSQNLSGNKEYISTGTINLEEKLKIIDILCDESTFFLQEFIGDKVYTEYGISDSIFPLNVKYMSFSIKNHNTLNLKNNVVICVEFIKI